MSCKRAECLIFIPMNKEGPETREHSRYTRATRNIPQNWDCSRGYVLLSAIFMDRHPKMARLFEQSSLRIVRNADVPRLPAPDHELDVVEILLNESPEASVNPLSVISNHPDISYLSLLIYSTVHTRRQTSLEVFQPSAVRPAVDKTNYRAFEHLINRNFKYTQTDFGGILHLATVRWQEVLMRTVLDNGIDVSSKTSKGSTAMHLAVDGESISLVELLLDRGAHVDEIDGSGFTSLHIACQKSEIQLPIVELLLERGANVNAMTTARRTPLHLAAKVWEPMVSLVVMLMQHGARFDENYERCQGETILQLASMGWSRSCIDPVKFLLEYRCINPKQFFLNFRNLLNDLSGSGPRHHCTVTYWERISRQQLVMSHGVKIMALHNLQKFEGVRLTEVMCTYPWLSASFYEQFRQECEAEVALMKSEKLGDTDVSMRDALSRDEYRVSRLLRNPSVSRAIDRGILKERFPRYANILNNHFTEGKLRMQLQIEGIQSFKSLSRGSQKLPDEIVEKILGLLDSMDIFKLRHASEIENGPENE